MTEKHEIVEYIDGKPIYKVAAPSKPGRLVLPRCKHCGSVNTTRTGGTAWKLKSGVTHYQCHCNSCGKTFTGSLARS